MLKKYKYLLVFMISFLWIGISFASNIKTIKPHLGSLQKSFTEPAKTHLENTYSINMPIDGKLQRVTFREGDLVKKGETVAVMEQEPLVQAVNKAIASSHTVAAQLALQRKTVARYQKLMQKNYINEAELDQALAQENVLQAKAVEAAAGIAVAKYDLQQSTMLSPINGVVLNRYNQGGKWLQMGAPLLRIGDLKQLEVICDVLTQEAQEVRVGDPVILTSIGTTAILHGTIKQIYPAGFTKQSSLGVDEQRVNVVVSLKKSDKAKFGLGYRLQAKFLVGAKEHKVIIIPRFSVLQDSNGNYYVFLVKNNKMHKRIIKLGILTDEQVSVATGLTMQDEIIAQPTADMQDGMKI